ncbi:MAG: hypothetical protein HWN67_12640 [Candidatus Helarchaeota archaeon]|nr:hypothetical protein [Candidatus Helarchaeota archaeon]
MEDKEQILSRVVGFLYDALENFKSTMDDVSGSLNTLMSSLTKVEKDLSILGVQPKHTTPMTSSQIAERIKAGTTSTSRERLIGLLTGKPLSSAAASAGTPLSTSKPTPAVRVSKPIPTAGPPKRMVGPPKTMASPPKPMKLPSTAVPSIKTAAPPVMRPPTVSKPPTVPTMKTPPATATPPPIMKPPTPPMAKPAPSPATAAAKPGGSIIGLRDEMLKELKRLKSIMKGG